VRWHPIGCPETSVRNYLCTLRNTPEECRSHFRRNGSQNSRIRHCNSSELRKPNTHLLSVPSQTTQTLNYATVRALNLVIAVYCANLTRSLIDPGWGKSGICNAKRCRKGEILGSRGGTAEDLNPFFVLRVDTTEVPRVKTVRPGKHVQICLSCLRCNSRLGYTGVVSRRSSDSYFSSCLLLPFFEHGRKFSDLCSTKRGLNHLDMVVVIIIIIIMSGR